MKRLLKETKKAFQYNLYYLFGKTYRYALITTIIAAITAFVTNGTWFGTILIALLCYVLLVLAIALIKSFFEALQSRPVPGKELSSNYYYIIDAHKYIPEIKEYYLNANHRKILSYIFSSKFSAKDMRNVLEHDYQYLHAIANAPVILDEKGNAREFPIIDHNVIVTRENIIAPVERDYKYDRLLKLVNDRFAEVRHAYNSVLGQDTEDLEELAYFTIAINIVWKMLAEDKDKIRIVILGPDKFS